jgi:hypothetical protein
LAAKVAKTHGGSTPIKTAKKSTFVGSISNQHTTDQPADNKKKGAADKEVLVDLDDTDKKLCLSTELDAKYKLALVTFLLENLDVFA